jgi:hypothetical protein
MRHTDAMSISRTVNPSLNPQALQPKYFKQRGFDVRFTYMFDATSTQSIVVTNFYL